MVARLKTNQGSAALPFFDALALDLFNNFFKNVQRAANDFSYIFTAPICSKLTEQPWNVIKLRINSAAAAKP